MFELAGTPASHRHVTSESFLSYEDFVYLILAEEDRCSIPSLLYLFRCADLDCDGKLTAHELRFFYEEQLYRLSAIGQVKHIY